MTIKKLNEIADIFNGVRLTRYIDENGNKEKVFIGTPTESLNWGYEFVSSKVNNKFFSKMNDIIFHLTNFDKIELVKEEGIIIPMHYAVIRLNDNLNPEFIYQFLKSNHVKNELNKYKEGSSLKIIKLEYLKQIKIDIPDIETQNKYGVLLSLLDQKLIMKNKQIELIDEFKNSIWQNRGDNNV